MDGTYQQILSPEQLRTKLAEIMGVTDVNSDYTLSIYLSKIEEIKNNFELKNQIKQWLEDFCQDIQSRISNSNTLFKYDITIMDQQIDGGQGTITRKYIYLIPVGQFNNFLKLFDLQSYCVQTLTEARKANEKRLSLYSFFDKNIKGITTYRVGGRKTRRQKKSKRTRKSKRRRYRKTRK